MSPCLSWGYFLKKLGIRRKRTRSIPNTDISAGNQHQREDLTETQDPMHVQRFHENNKYDISLLHPDWRRFPHVPIYGWTNDHEEQLKNLTNMIINGSLVSAYYDSETDYRASRFLNNCTILPGPNVSDVNEAIFLLRRNKGFQYNSYCNDNPPEYDADDESENNSKSIERYYNHYKPRRHVEEQTAI